MGTTALFETRIVNLDADPYLLGEPGKVLANAETENKEKYFHPCVDKTFHFNPPVYSNISYLPWTIIFCIDLLTIAII